MITHPKSLKSKSGVYITSLSLGIYTKYTLQISSLTSLELNNCSPYSRRDGMHVQHGYGR